MRRQLFFPIIPHPYHFWVRITPGRGLPATSAGQEELLVLEAKGIPFQTCLSGRREHVYVPALLGGLARSEIDSYKKEKRGQREIAPAWPLFKGWEFATLYLLLILFFHLLRFTQIAYFPTDPSDWLNWGALDSIRVFFHGEWWRAGTALALHKDVSHLVGNLFFGSIFLMILARLCGTGIAWFLAVSGGILGNVISVFMHDYAYRSIGFSTALFAVLGAAGALMICRSSNRILAPLAGVIGLLAMLGSDSLHSDYIAHLCGLAAGFILGTCTGIAFRHKWKIPPQWLWGSLALIILLLAWAPVFQHWR